MNEAYKPTPPVGRRFEPGQSGNPNGRPKGTKNLATIVRELESEDFDWSKVPIKQKEAAKSIGSPWRAIVFTALAKAMSGDVKAMEWLRKSGYGDKLDVTLDPESFNFSDAQADRIAARLIANQKKTSGEPDTE